MTALHDHLAAELAPEGWPGDPEDLPEATFDAAATFGNESYSRFKITDKGAADWALRKLGRVEADLAADEALAAAEIERITWWLNQSRERAAGRRAFFEGLLAEWHASILDTDPKAKTLRLPAGELTARKAPDKVEVDDPAAFQDWAEGNGRLELLNITIKPALAEIKKATSPGAWEDQAAPAVDADGVVLPGVRWVQGEVRFTAKPGGAA